MTQTTTSAERGMAMFLVLGFLAIVTMITASMFTLIHVTLTQAGNAGRHQQCMGLAEAGADLALARLVADPNRPYAGESETALGEGAFAVEVEPEEGQPMYRIRATGLLRDGTRVLAKAQVVLHAGIGPDGRIRSLQWEEVR